jgi:hypothetical protein
MMGANPREGIPVIIKAQTVKQHVITILALVALRGTMRVPPPRSVPINHPLQHYVILIVL